MEFLTLEIKILNETTLDGTLNLIGCELVDKSKNLYKYKGNIYELVTPNFLETHKFIINTYELEFKKIEKEV